MYLAFAFACVFIADVVSAVWNGNNGFDVE